MEKCPEKRRDTTTSDQAFDAAQKVIPGGVDSPVRACSSVGCAPIFYDHAHGSRVIDVDGNSYVDFIGSWGPMILGHAYEPILSAVREALDRSTSFGAPCQAETMLAQKIVNLVPSIEKVRFVSSGTEATMSAIRLARGYTGRSKFIKFEGNYHGHSDALLVSAGSGVATFNIPGTPGVTQGAVADTLLADYNALDRVKEHFKTYPDDIAAVIVEPVAGNMGVVAPTQEFLSGLRELCDTYGAALIFDEVITGFRVARAGAQEYFDIQADLTTYGKIIGGGFPVGAFGGRAEIMDCLAPLGPVYQAGTLSGNPIAMTAGIAMLDALGKSGVYDELERKGRRLEDGLKRVVQQLGKTYTINRVGSLLTLFFTDQPCVNWESVKKADVNAYAAFYKGMVDRGFIIAPSQFEALFVSMAHTDEELDAFCEAAGAVLSEL